ncbi:MAG TPA: SRPBCC family protein [Rubrobacter sp.]|nr:SRPBCC family protein [Rubrobacter sp.]
MTLPADDRILITREFDAPKHLVYRAWTEPGLIERWWGGERGEVTSVEVDLRVGGVWRCVMVLEDGTEAAFRGEYREVVANERIVSTEVYEGAPGAQALNTVTFEESEGRTTLKVLVEHASKEARDAHLASGMETGMQAGLNLLEELVFALG